MQIAPSNTVLDGEIVPADQPLTTALILSGEGYRFEVAPAALAQKKLLIDAARAIVAVTDDASCEAAQARLKGLSVMRNFAEKSRVEVKAPVLKIGKEIDETAKTFSADIVTEEARLSGLVTEYVREQQRIAREKELEAERERQRLERERHEAELAAQREQMRIEREKMEAEKRAHEAELERLRAEAAKSDEAQAEARRKQEAALAEQREAEARLKAAQEQAERNAAAARQREQEAVTVPTPAVTPKGVTEQIDFEVLDVAAFYAKFPQFCEVTIKRGPLLTAIKASFDKKGKLPEIPGLRVFQNIKVKGR